MRIGILKQGDQFAGLFGNLIAIKKPSGEVELTEVLLDDNGLIRLADKPKLCIGYGNNVVEVSNEDGNIEVATF